MITLDGLQLPGLFWENEFEWSNVVAEVDYSLARVPIIWEGGKINFGRLIDLVGTETTGLLKREIMLSLQQKANIVGSVYVLVYNGAVLNVRFRNEDMPCVSGAPLVGYDKIKDSDYYKNVVIKLMEV